MWIGALENKIVSIISFSKRQILTLWYNLLKTVSHPERSIQANEMLQWKFLPKSSLILTHDFGSSSKLSMTIRFINIKSYLIWKTITPSQLDSLFWSISPAYIKMNRVLELLKSLVDIVGYLFQLRRNY